jgi:ELWxxDGT repeat protein
MELSLVAFLLFSPSLEDVSVRRFVSKVSANLLSLNNRGNIEPRKRYSTAKVARNRRLIVEGLEDRRLLTVVGRIVEDAVPLGGINNGSLGSEATEIVSVGGVGYFAASDGINGSELWKVTPSGPSNFAQLVEDSIAGGGIAAGPYSSNPTYLTNFNGTLYFSADDGVNGRELWRLNSIGIAEMVEDSIVGEGINAFGSSNPDSLTVVGGALFFVASDGVNGREVWRLDGSGIATMVEDSVPGDGIGLGVFGPDASELTNVGGQLYFSASDGKNGFELWRVPAGSGTASMVEDSVAGNAIGVSPDPDIGAGYSALPQSLTNINGTLYFSASDGSHGFELWRVSGSGNASMVDDTLGGTDGIGIGSYGVYPSSMTLSGGIIYFRGITSAEGDELWRITPSGTAQLVEDSIAGGGIAPGTQSSYPSSLTDVAGTLYFSATTTAEGNEVWRVNAVSGLAEIISRSGTTGLATGSASSAPEYLTNVAGTLYFQASDGINGVELWRATASVASLVEDSIAGGGIAPGASDSNPSEVRDIGGTAYFSASNALGGRELWRLNGSGIAQLVEDSTNSSDGGINPGPADSNPYSVIAIGPSIYFIADDGFNGPEVWKVVPGGTATLVSRGASVLGINSNSADSSPESYFRVGGTIYFSATDGINGRELWRINNVGVAELVEDSVPGGGLRPFSASSSPRDFTDVTGTLYFTADTDNGTGLWRINASGVAEMISEKLESGGFEIGSGTPRSALLTNVGGTLYFVADDGVSGNEVWQVLPGASTATLVETASGSGGVAAGSLSASPTSLTNAGGSLYFIAQNPTVGRELWTLDGSSNAVVVEDSLPGGGLYPGSDSSSPAELFVHQGTLYFRALDSTNGNELWVANGANASLVEDAIAGSGIAAGSAGSYPNGFVSVGSTLYFQASDAVNGAELWKLVGSGPAVMVEDSNSGGGINPGVASSNPRFLTNVAGSLYFTANDGSSGIELWRVDNVSELAERVEDSIPGGGIRPGLDSSGPNRLTDVGGTLFFVANDGSSGIELWRVPPGGSASIVEDSVAGGGIRPGIDSSTPEQLVNVNGTLYFAADNGSTGLELWSVQGAGIASLIAGPAGTIELLDGPIGSGPLQLANMNGTLYLSAYSGTLFGIEPVRILENGVPLVNRNNASVTGKTGTQISNTGTWSDPDGDVVNLVASLGVVVKNSNGTWAWSYTPTSYVINQVVTITASDAFGDSSNTTFTISAGGSVINRRLFYNRSVSVVFGDGSGNPTGSIDSSKTALLPGRTATFANVSGYIRGLNGIVVDVVGLGTPTSTDLVLATSTGLDAGFAASAERPTVGILRGVGQAGSDRLKIEFNDRVIRDTWLRVTILANSNTGLVTPDVFYFGNVVGDTGLGNLVDTQGEILRVNATDIALIRNNQSVDIDSVNVDRIHDVDKNGRVNSIDVALVRQNINPSSIRLITAPGSLQVSAEGEANGSMMLPPVVPPTTSKSENSLSSAVDNYFASYKLD